MAEATFDRAAFLAELHTRRLGRVLFTRAVVESTNDVAWELAQQGAGDGTCVVADAQTHGRGRRARDWYTAPGLGLALSLLLRPGCDRGALSTAPLVAGLALARAAARLGLPVRLKWPNDVLVGRRKLAGLLVESRRDADGADLLVVGAGVNVGQREVDFPADLRDRVTSFALEGRSPGREAVAAAFLDALEPLWAEHQEGDAAVVLDAWRREAPFWGRSVTVRGPAGDVAGVARDLDAAGGLIVETATGTHVTAYAGDLDVVWPEGA